MTHILSENIGKALAYSTEIQPGSGITVESTVISEPKKIDEIAAITNQELFNELFLKDDETPNGRAYEWIGAGSKIMSDQMCCWVLSYEDCYTQEQYDSRDIKCGAGNGFNYKTAAFSLTSGGTVYDDCRMVLIIYPPVTDVDKGTAEMIINVFYRVPEGYDGCVLGFHNSSALTQQQIQKGMSDPASSLGFISRTEGDLYLQLK